MLECMDQDCDVLIFALFPMAFLEIYDLIEQLYIKDNSRVGTFT